jgi:ribosomal protein S27AE
MTNQDNFSYYSAQAVKTWMLEKQARECGEGEMANHLKSSRKFCENQANLAKQMMDREANG